MAELAKAVGCSRSKVSRFFAGKTTGIGPALAILDKLKLKLEDVFTPINLDAA